MRTTANLKSNLLLWFKSSELKTKTLSKLFGSALFLTLNIHNRVCCSIKSSNFRRLNFINNKCVLSHHPTLFIILIIFISAKHSFCLFVRYCFVFITWNKLVPNRNLTFWMSQTAGQPSPHHILSIALSLFTTGTFLYSVDEAEHQKAKVDPFVQPPWHWNGSDTYL